MFCIRLDREEARAPRPLDNFAASTFCQEKEISSVGVLRITATRTFVLPCSFFFSTLPCAVLRRSVDEGSKLEFEGLRHCWAEN